MIPLVLDEKKKERLLYFFVFLFAFILSVFPVASYDLFWHLAFGKVQFLEKSYLSQEIFSHTRNGQPWFNHTWLTGLLFYIVYLTGGYMGLIIMKALLVTGIALMMTKVLNERGYKKNVIILLILLMLLSSLFRYLERPHLITYFFITLTYFVLEFYIRGIKGSKILFLLPIIGLLWVNFHSGVVFGAFLISLFILAEALKQILKDRSFFYKEILKRVKGLLFALLGFLSASLINPNGIKPYSQWFKGGNMDLKGASVNYMSAMGTEFVPPALQEFPLFWLSLLAITVLIIFYYKQIDIVDLVVALPFLILALRYNRAIGMFNIVMLPFFASLLDSFVRGTDRGKKVIAGGLVLLIGLVFYLKFFHINGKYSFGFGLNRDYIPVESADFISKNNLPGNMFNTEAIGGYLEWVFYPGRKVFYDNRTTIFGRLYEEMHEPGFMEKYDVNYGIIMRSQFPPEILFPQKNWALIFWDKCCSVYLKRTLQNAELINKYDIRYFKPTLNVKEAVGLAKKEGATKEIVREIETHLQYVDNLNAFLALAELYEERGKDEKEKMAFLMEGLKKWPHSFAVTLALANSHYRSGRNKIAKKYYKDVIKKGGGNEYVYLNLGYIAYDEGAFEEAEGDFLKSLKYNDTLDSVYYGLGLVYEKNGKIKKAVKYLEEYVKRSHDSKWKTIAENKLIKLKKNEKK